MYSEKTTEDLKALIALETDIIESRDAEIKDLTKKLEDLKEEYNKLEGSLDNARDEILMLTERQQNGQHKTYLIRLGDDLNTEYYIARTMSKEEAMIMAEKETRLNTDGKRWIVANMPEAFRGTTGTVWRVPDETAKILNAGHKPSETIRKFRITVDDKKPSVEEAFYLATETEPLAEYYYEVE